MVQCRVREAETRQAVLRETDARRKGIQAIHLGEFESAIEPARARLLELEGQDMRDAIQEKVCLPARIAHASAVS